MRQSISVIKTRREVPHDEVAKSAQLLIRAGYINKTMAGVYEFLPLGFRTLQNIITVIREEMNAIGGQEVFLTALQNPEVWKKTDRWSGDAEEVWFKSHIGDGGDVGFGWTHEEPITYMMRQHIQSHRDLPAYLYQFQTKFRNEKRAKSGILRTREFIMKDLYSFTKDTEEHARFYEQCAEAYLSIYRRVGIGDETYRTFASGGAFAKFSDEFQVVSSIGEDTIFLCREKNIAINKEVYNDETIATLKMQGSSFEECSAIEVGNIFTLGTRFSEALGLMYKDESGNEKPVFMGSYGIGPARLLGVIVEKFGGDNGMVLPSAIAPYTVHLICLGNDEVIDEEAVLVYQELQKKGISVLFDDRREVSAGEKFADADLIGIPYRLIVSDKAKRSGGVEYTDRLTAESKIVPVEEAVKTLALHNVS